MSNTTDTNLRTNLCTKIGRDNTCDNGVNTRGNVDNIGGKPYQLKLNYMDCHIICHVRFGAQIGVPNIIIYIYICKEIKKLTK